MIGLGVKNPIREKELQRLKNSIRIGARINVKTLKVSQGRHASGAHQRHGGGERNRDSKVSASGVGGACKWLNGKCDMGGAGGAEEREKQERQMMDK